MKTLELKDLKHYLGTELKWTLQGLKTFKMSGLSNETLYTEEGSVLNWRKHEDLPQALFPCFLPISALTEPLPDGSIPIVELAKIAEMLEPISFDKMEDHVRLQRGVTAKDRFNNQWLMFDFKHGFSMWHKPHHELDHRPTLCDNQLALFEYLYANHFWLGDQSLFETGEIIDKRNLK